MAIIFYESCCENYERICWPWKLQSYCEHKNNDTNIHLDECLPCLTLSFWAPHISIFLVMLRNYGLWWKAREGYCCHGSKNIFFSLKNSMSETSGKKIMLTALAEKIKFKYKFLQFYQVLFIYVCILICKDALQGVH